jgi:signal transduction histidine kinase
VERIAGWPGIASGLQTLQSGKAALLPPWVLVHHLSATLEIFNECMFVTDRQGRVLWTKPIGLGLVGTSLATDPEVRQVFERRATRISNLHRDGFWPKPHITVASPIMTDTGDLVGVIGGLINPTKLGNQFLTHEVLEQAGDTEVYVVDGADGIIMSTTPRRQLDRLDGDEVRALRAHPRGVEFLFKAATQSRVFSVHPLSVAPFALVIAQSVKQLHGEASRIRRSLLGAAALLAAVLVLGALPLTNSVTQPLQALAAEARRIASGELSHPIPIEGRDEVTALAASLENMRTQLRESQMGLQAHVAELAELNRLKSEFIANISHEFRTPLHISRGYVDLLLDGSIAKVPDDLRDPLQAIQRNHDALCELIGNCLDLAKIDTGKEAVNVERFDLCEVARESMAEFGLRMRAKSLRGLVHAPDTPCEVTTDREKVQRILRNLISNAVKFTEQGQIEVSLEEGPGPSMVTLHVRDTGTGVSEENQRKIFERFNRVGGASAKPYGGVGLGLNISSELASLLGGSMTVVSSPGAGSTFSFTFARVFVAREERMGSGGSIGGKTPSESA